MRSNLSYENVVRRRRGNTLRRTRVQVGEEATDLADHLAELGRPPGLSGNEEPHDVGQSDHQQQAPGHRAPIQTKYDEAHTDEERSEGM